MPACMWDLTSICYGWFQILQGSKRCYHSLFSPYFKIGIHVWQLHLFVGQMCPVHLSWAACHLSQLGTIYTWVKQLPLLSFYLCIHKTLTMVVGIEVQQLGFLPRKSTSPVEGSGFKFCFCFKCSFLLNTHPGRHQMMPQVLGAWSLPLIWKTWTEFLIPSQGCSSPGCCRHWGVNKKWKADSLSLSLTLSVTLLSNK